LILNIVFALYHYITICERNQVYILHKKHVENYTLISAHIFRKSIDNGRVLVYNIITARDKG